MSTPRREPVRPTDSFGLGGLISMRRYDEPIEVRRGLVAGQEAPEQFIWRDRLWVVRDVISHWVETGAWWDQPGIAALLGVGAESVATSRGSEPVSAEATPSRTGRGVPLGADLLAESDVWRVEAMDGRRRMDGLRRRWTPRSDGVARGGSTSHPPTKPRDDDSDSDFVVGYGVFDLAFDWTQARWRLIGCLD